MVALLKVKTSRKIKSNLVLEYKPTLLHRPCSKHKTQTVCKQFKTSSNELYHVRDKPPQFQAIARIVTMQKIKITLCLLEE